MFNNGLLFKCDYLFMINEVYKCKRDLLFGCVMKW